MRTRLLVCGVISILLTSCSEGLQLDRLQATENQIKKTPIPKLEIKPHVSPNSPLEIEVQRGVKIDSIREKQLLKQKEKQSKVVTGFFKTSLESFKEDNLITVNFSVQNISEEDQQITIGSGKKYDFVVYNEQNKEVYRWSNNKSFTAALLNMNFKKGEKLSFTEKWNLQDDQGELVPQGKYTIVVQVLINLMSRTISKEDLTNQINIEISQ